MKNEARLDEDVYTNDNGKTFSMRDLLQYFSKYGTMRISDLHLKVGCPPLYRLDGDLQRMKGPDLTIAQMKNVVDILLAEAEKEYLAKDRAVDTSVITADLQFRLNCFYDNDGLSVAIRALESRPPDVEAIGFPNQVWRDLVKIQAGLVLVTGITGAGKSTTIASLVDRIMKTRPVRVITLEDPIEYRLSSARGVISQREIGRDVPSFERGLRDALREDPDVIFVGEMRDRVSTAWTLTAAETGHLVFSTLHTRDVRGTITRLLDMFPPERQDEVANQISLGLRYVLCQKLIPRADGEGRVVAMEILHNTYATANTIRTKKVEQLYTLLQTRVRDVPEERMCSMERSLAELVHQGVVAPLEAEKWANDPNTFLDEMQRLSERTEGGEDRKPGRKQGKAPARDDAEQG